MNSTAWIMANSRCWVKLEEKKQQEEEKKIHQNSINDAYQKGLINKVDQARKKANVQLEGQGGSQDFPFEALLPCSTGNNLEGLDDMVKLEQLNEAEILNNLLIRYQQDYIFTYIGPTLIVINPYKNLQDMFSHKKISDIENALTSNENFQLSDCEPHVFAIAAEAYKNLFKNKKKQAIVISGESGAGKTENAKYAMRFLTQLSQELLQQKEQQLQNYSSNQKKGAKQQQKNTINNESVGIEERILSCNPILEAFGNAKTIRNDNSSRFGKYVRLMVEGLSRRIVGAAITKYLLEKSRITSLAKDERNYHIFYHFLAGMGKDELNQLHIESGDCNKFALLRESGCWVVNSINDSAMMKQIKDSMQKMGFSKEEENAVWHILASILLLGNIEFDDSQFLENVSPCAISQSGQLAIKNACDLLQIDQNQLQKGFLFKNIQDVKAKTSIETPSKKPDCIAKRDSLNKALYDRLFTWLVERLNQQIKLQDNAQQKDVSIGLLDIFGFENFVNNSFEQICINYANEHLQQLYIAYVFKNEQKVLAEDGLQDFLKSLTYADNQVVLDCFDKQPGIFSLLNDKCLTNTSTDEQLQQTIIKQFKDNPKIIAPKIGQINFTIVHTQSNVTYNVQTFIQKNMDDINNEIKQTLIDSKNEIVRSIFQIDQQVQQGGNQSQTVAQNKYLGSKFKMQMNDLMGELNQCDVHFVRCIKPNQEKLKEYLVTSYALLQIRYLGVLESIQVRKATYPCRKQLLVFFQQYQICHPEFEKRKVTPDNIKQACKELIQKVFPKHSNKEYLIGINKVYLKPEAELDWDKKKSETIQEKMKKVAQKVIACYKGYKVRKMYKRKREGATRINKQLSIIAQFTLKYTFKSIKHRAGARVALHSFTIQIKKIVLQIWQNQAAQLKEVAVRALESMFQEANQANQVAEDLTKKNIANVYNENELKKINYKQKNKNDNESDEYTQQLNQQQYNSSNQSLNDESIAEQSQYLKDNSVIHDEEQKQYQSSVLNISEIQRGAEENMKSVARLIDPQTLELELEVGPLTKEEMDPNFMPLIIKLLDDKKQKSQQNQESCDASNSFDTAFSPENIDEHLKQEILKFKFYDFFDKQLRSRSTFLRGKKKITDVMSVKFTPLKGGPLHVLTKAEDKNAQRTFQIILQLINDVAKNQDTGVKQVLLVRELLELSYGGSEKLRDEIFTQIIKQTNQSQQHHLTTIQMNVMMQLMTCYLYCYKPNKEYIMAALHHFYNLYHSQDIDADNKQFIRCIIARLIIAYRQDNKQKKVLPPNYQLMALMWMKQVWIPVFFPTGSHVLICVDQSDKIDDMKERVLQKVDINTMRVPALYFGCFEVVNKKSDVSERMLKGNEYVWDMLAQWEVERDLSMKRQDEAPIYIFMMKVIFCFKIIPQDKVSIAISFSQTFFDVYVGKLRIEDNDLIKMGAILLATNNGQGDVKNLMPHYSSFKDKDKLKDLLMEEYKKIGKIDIIDAKFLYLQIARKYDCFMGVHIPVKYSPNQNDQPQDIILVMKPMKLIMLSYTGRKTFKIYNFSEITRWGLSHGKYLLMITTDGLSHLIETAQAESIGWFISTVSNLLIKRNDKNNYQSQSQNGSYNSTQYSSKIMNKNY